MKTLWNALSPIVKFIVIVLIVGAFTGLGYVGVTKGWIPGIKSAESKLVDEANMNDEGVNTHSSSAKLQVPDIDELEFADVEDRPEIRLMNWVWFGNAGIFSANGGQKTMKGTLMDQYKVNLRMITNNSVSDMKAAQLAFISALADGEKHPKKGVNFVTIMGDGAPAYISAMNPQIIKAHGSEYRLKAFGIAGFSMGEDCVIGPLKWKNDPNTLRGAIICTVIGDGDWGLAVRFGRDNGIPVNPDPGTYDPNAMNFVPAPEDDFLKAAQEVLHERTVKLKLKNAKGILTGEVVEKKIEGAGTWFPGDRQLVEKSSLVNVVSTAKYPNQMATTIIGCDKWLKDNSELVVRFLSATLTATNQIKQYPEWFTYATKLAPKVFCASATDCSETAKDWHTYAVAGGAEVENADGVKVSVGGTQMANLADNLKYFGVSGGNNYYESVYNYFNSVLKALNPAGFMDNVGELTSYEDAVDLSYLKRVKIESGQTTAVDYSRNKGEKFASAARNIQFANGSAELSKASIDELEDLFTSINLAENARVQIVGHTDNVGNADQNLSLSILRARAVKKWLIERSKGSYSSERFIVDGRGQEEPVATNATASGRAKNRRVQTSLLL